jgi:hypothetical protein
VDIIAPIATRRSELEVQLLPRGATSSEYVIILNVEKAFHDCQPSRKRAKNNVTNRILTIIKCHMFPCMTSISCKRRYEIEPAFGRDREGRIHQWRNLARHSPLWDTGQRHEQGRNRGKRHTLDPEHVTLWARW